MKVEHVTVFGDSALALVLSNGLLSRKKNCTTKNMTPHSNIEAKYGFVSLFLEMFTFVGQIADNGSEFSALFKLIQTQALYHRRQKSANRVGKVSPWYFYNSEGALIGISALGYASQRYNKAILLLDNLHARRR